MNVLIVEDEVRLAEALAHIIEEHRFHVDVVHDGQAGLDYLTSDFYDVAVVDVMLPKLDGFQLVKAARKSGHATPILMLTARNTLPDKVQGLDLGADDYMTKPFQPEELMARLRALTRRSGEVMVHQITVGDLTLDLSTSDLHCNNRNVHLSFKEFEVLKLLFAHPGQTFSKDSLLTKIWGIESSAEENNVEAYISFLRKKLAYLESSVEIVTLRMIGYRLQVPAKSDAGNGPTVSSSHFES